MPEQTTSSAAEIRLENLTKIYPGQDVPAVEDVTLTIPAGEVVVLVGPSGCGKTTTMRMINRLIEPTSGTIYLGDEDITHADPDRMRRRMGYAIQKTGLFPHMTIFDNVATVPRLLKWDGDRVRDRVNELLDLVGLDPDMYGQRYPKELSGGQQQRVGVARAMAADPPVMLMDEPFGATDPITRERLQNEFLRIQGEVGKTIVFVTHDIDEAIKMGDRIAILSERSVIEQYDTPETILTAPANDFVSDFIGGGASLKRLNLTRIRDLDRTADWPTATPDTPVAKLRKQLDDADVDFALLLDEQGRPDRWLTSHDLREVSENKPLSEMGRAVQAIVEPQATLADALNEMIVGTASSAVVVDGKGRYEGIVDIETITSTIKEMRAQSADDLRRRRKAAAEAGEVMA